MLIPAIVRALRQPPFQGSDFTATRFAIAEDKAAFGSEMMCFIAADFPQRSWNEKLYRRLSNCFGLIAHYAEDVVMRSNGARHRPPWPPPRHCGFRWRDARSA